jgi:hypothetical protein
VLIGALDEDRLDARDGVGGNNVLNGGQGRYALLKDPGDVFVQRETGHQ